ncbi:P2X purinoceptor 7 [Labeo rohita]|uniref:P2X purinoceptor 7 n=1 Tax=Labeo rohita TaxID=84645 RepID=A0ABQ8MMM6_LABRO|nr:P2X purinoceptor 7 [Labeo rohita]
MVDHPGLEPVCLNVFSLQNALNIYRADYGPLGLQGIETRYRFLAYRSFVSWCWGFLGQRIRVVLPSCVVRRIRAEFPDSQGRYVGFRPALD